MNHLKAYSLFEASDPLSIDLDSFLGDLAKYYDNYRVQLSIKYPEDHEFYPETVGAPEWEFKTRFGGWDYQKNVSKDTGDVLGFIVDALKDSRYIINRLAFMEKERAKYFRGCYYNSLDYALRYKSKYKDLKLCFGYLIPKSTIDKISVAARQDPAAYQRVVIEITQHAFLINGGRVIDPTLGRVKDEYYVYEEVPENLWSTFKHKPNDTNFDARDFVDYIRKRIDSHEFSFKELMKYLK